MEDGFGPYTPQHYTTAAVFFVDKAYDTERIFNLRPHHDHLRLPNLSYIPHPITILSSSFGFVLCRDSSSSYHVFDPLSYPLAAHMSLPDPDRRRHANASPAVLVFHRPPVFPLISENHFYAVCAIHEGRGNYTFDTFNTLSRAWTSAQGPIHIGGRNTRILLNTGVSCEGRAFWLTNRRQPLVVIHDPHTMATTTFYLRLPLTGFWPHMRPQLGRIGSCLCLVVVNNRRCAVLYSLNIRQGYSRIHLQTSARLLGVETPLPLRFESDKLEVLFACADGIVQLWEANAYPFRGTRVVELDVNNNAPAVALDDIANSVPYVLPSDMPHLDELPPSPREELFLNIRIDPYLILQVMILLCVLIQSMQEQSWSSFLFACFLIIYGIFFN